MYNENATDQHARFVSFPLDLDECSKTSVVSVMVYIIRP